MVDEAVEQRDAFVVTDQIMKAVEGSEDYGSLTDLYIQCRDEEEALKRENTDKNTPIKNLKNILEGKLLAMIEASGLESVKTSAGTVYKLPKTSAKVADWQVLLDYIKKNDAFDLLTKNVSKDAVKARIEESNEIVPGVDMYTIITVGIRRS